MTNKTSFALGSLEILPLDLKIHFRNHPVDVTLTEMKILLNLMKNHPEMISRDELSQRVWENQLIQPSTLNTHISNLRAKFKDWEYEILNLKKQGYRLISKS